MPKSQIIIGDWDARQKRQKFLTAGSLLFDITLPVGGIVEEISFSLKKIIGFFLEHGKKVNSMPRVEAIGGGGGNAAYTLLVQGNEVATMGVVGNDYLGQSIIDYFTNIGIDSSRIVKTPEFKTGMSVIISPENGNGSIITDRSAASHLEKLNTNLTGSGYDWLYASGFSGKFSVLRKLFKSCEQNGIKIFFNPSKAELGDKKKLLRILKYVNIVSMNNEESEMIVKGSDIDTRIRNLKSCVKDIAIITDGDKGAVAASSLFVYKAPIYQNVKIVSTVGAGDAFNGAFLSAIANGMQISDALIYASANATSVLQFVDAKTGALKKGTKLNPINIQKTYT